MQAPASTSAAARSTYSSAMVREVAAEELPVAGAVGIAEEYVDRAAALTEAGACMLVVDVAHGHMERTLSATETLAERFPDTPVCAGNVVTGEAVTDLAAAGATA